MELQNSYIFIKQSDSDMTKDNLGNYHLVLGDSIVNRLETVFPNLQEVGTGSFFGKEEYCCSISLSKQIVQLKIAISRVARTTFVDVSANSKTTGQGVKALEHVHDRLSADSFTKDYILIVSYDAVSEYFCNKAFPLLNTLERNLRKLLLNTYIANFGKEYYQVTISEDIQSKAKKLIGNKGGKSAIEIRRIQQFFYSLEYGDIEAMLFTPVWTRLEEECKQKLLAEDKDLSRLSDQELRDEISKIQPRSDWERFFSKKVKLENIGTMLGEIRNSRNAVAHVKIFRRCDYNTCKTLVESLNSAIIEAIRITEDKEFVEKNQENLRDSVVGVLEKVQSFTQWVGERATRTAQTLAPLFESLGKVVLAMHQEEMENAEQDNGSVDADRIDCKESEDS